MIQHLVLLLSIGLGFCLVVVRQQILPGRFSYDGNRIRDIALGHRSSYGDKGYQRVADLYRATGLVGHDTTVGLLNFLILVVVVLLVRRQVVQASRAAAVNGFIFVTLTIGAIYLGYYSKDLIALVVSVAVVLAGPRKRADLFVAGVMGVYGFLFRGYWLLIAGAYLGLRVCFRKGGWLGLVLGGWLGLIGLGLAIVIFQHHAADYYRTSVNLSRVGDPDAQSMLLPLMSSDSVMAGLVNLTYAAITLVLPWPLALLGGVYYPVLSALFVAIWGTFGIRAYKLRSVKANWRLARSVCFVAAFLCVDALFEPDYGSALRHIATIMPTMLYVVWSRDPTPDQA